MTPDTVDERSRRLDVLSAIIPIDRRDNLASMLTDADVETLRHLAEQGIGANSIRALVSDISYLEAWSMASTGLPLPWPAPVSLVLRFIAHHLYDAEEHARNEAHGMPLSVAETLQHAGVLKVNGPHAPSTVARRLSSWGKLHAWKGIQSSTTAPEVKAALRLATRACQRLKGRKSPMPITGDILDLLLETCRFGELIDVRDAAIMLTMFASGGRRCSEVASLVFSQVADEHSLPNDDPSKPPLPCLSIRLGRTKTEAGQDGARVYLAGRGALALRHWMALARISVGPVFRPIGRWGDVRDAAITGKAISNMVKRRCQAAGMNPCDFSPHGFRSGYVTQAVRDGVPLPQIMEQTRHASIRQLSRYYQGGAASNSLAVRVGI
jgi:integrase